ncbi:MAG: aminotransferase class III-fold pyridoxal phosphate-dependent enzyme [bacterium]
MPFMLTIAKKKTFYHGHTYTANPLACAAALASLKVFNRENTFKRVRYLMSFLNKELEKFRVLPIVGDVRCLGMIGAVELVKNKDTKELFSDEERIGLTVYKEGLKERLILRPLGSVIYLYLPLNTKKVDLEVILKRMFKVIQHLI